MTIEEIEKILIACYGDPDKGCYVDGRWFSINEIIRVLKKHM